MYSNNGSNSNKKWTGMRCNMVMRPLSASINSLYTTRKWNKKLPVVALNNGNIDQHFMITTQIDRIWDYLLWEKNINNKGTSKFAIRTRKVRKYSKKSSADSEYRYGDEVNDKFESNYDITESSDEEDSEDSQKTERNRRESYSPRKRVQFNFGKGEFKLLQKIRAIINPIYFPELLHILMQFEECVDKLDFTEPNSLQQLLAIELGHDLYKTRDKLDLHRFKNDFIKQKSRRSSHGGRSRSVNSSKSNSDDDDDDGSISLSDTDSEAEESIRHSLYDKFPGITNYNMWLLIGHIITSIKHDIKDIYPLVPCLLLFCHRHKMNFLFNKFVYLLLEHCKPRFFWYFWTDLINIINRHGFDEVDTDILILSYMESKLDTVYDFFNLKMLEFLDKCFEKNGAKSMIRSIALTSMNIACDLFDTIESSHIASANEMDDNTVSTFQIFLSYYIQSSDKNVNHFSELNQVAERIMNHKKFYHNEITGNIIIKLLRLTCLYLDVKFEKVVDTEDDIVFSDKEEIIVSAELFSFILCISKEIKNFKASFSKISNLFPQLVLEYYDCHKYEDYRYDKCYSILDLSSNNISSKPIDSAHNRYLRLKGRRSKQKSNIGHKKAKIGKRVKTKAENIRILKKSRVKISKHRLCNHIKKIRAQSIHGLTY
ncbi:hypothetical protein B5S28_g2182 [[Candida] boidinii]|nr:hypothetical protein B5S28_g2182 [[Candida] boidinii]OWB63056.1 hypothetical protein B5S29_g4010 [[Candida] boidinii]